MSTMRTPTARNAPADRVARPPGFADERLAQTPRFVQAATFRVVAAFDGSPAGNDALALSALLARSPGARLVVACAFPFETLTGIPFEPRETRIANGDHRIFVRQDADAVLAEARAALPDDLDVTFRALSCASVPQGLRQLALSETADLRVLGSTRRGRLARRSHRGLALGLMRDPPCPVAVVPGDPRDRPRSASQKPECSPHGRRSPHGEVLRRFLQDLRRGGK